MSFFFFFFSITGNTIYYRIKFVTDKTIVQIYHNGNVHGPLKNKLYGGDGNTTIRKDRRDNLFH